MALEKNIQFATDDTFPAGVDPWSGDTNKTEPSAQRKAEGFLPESPLSAEEANWLHHYHGKEIAKLDALVVNSPALTFGPDVKIGCPVSRIKYHHASGWWMACGPGPAGATDEPTFLRTGDPNRWPSTTELATSGLTPDIIQDFAVNDDGVILTIDTNIDYIHKFDGVSTWSVISGAYGEDPGGAAGIVWDRATDTWCIVSRHSGLPYIRVATSTDDGVTWTPRVINTVPSTTIGVSMETDDNGTIWVQIFDSTGVVRFTTSTNGGVTWSAIESVTITGVLCDPTSIYWPKPCFDGVNWGAVVPDQPSSCAVLKKTPTGNWELVNTYAGTLCLESIAAHPSGGWMGIDTSKRVALSNDYLETFHFTDFKATTDLVTSFGMVYNVACSGYRFVVVGERVASDTYCWFSGGAGAGQNPIPTT